jgi:hypothetical protein
MIRVNTAFAAVVFENIGGLADFDNVKPELEFWHDTPDGNSDVREVVMRYVVPDVKAFKPEFLAKAKLAIQYLLTFNPEAADRTFPSILAPCSPSRPASLMYEWVWEEVFPGESWELDRSLEYQVVYDPDETNTWKTVDGALVPSPFIGEEFRVDWRTYEK